MKRRHSLRRWAIFLFPIVAASLFSWRFTFTAEINDFYETLKVLIGVWATLLGFIITAASILVTFNGSKLTEEIKNTGHFKTVLFTYMLTCIELLIFLSVFIGILFMKTCSLLVLKVFVASVIISMLNVLLCLILLSLVIYTIFK